MKRFINILNKNRDLSRSIILSIVLVSALMAYFFYSAADLPFVYSQF
ncbi:hypothetical protein [Clostridium saccharoperbutylacetonicum]|nr:hypothetical protein [Clostridium saccharoperbutylacetonicum]AQR97951.1 hypothetical protein CLSAP_52840 [Clostridium saccharoperbutylacetonicum]NSB33844.1 membrane protein involved in colicin uptake [Clostridium saccharoperbutylacetonicum]